MSISNDRTPFARSLRRLFQKLSNRARRNPESAAVLVDNLLSEIDETASMSSYSESFSEDGSETGTESVDELESTPEPEQGSTDITPVDAEVATTPVDSAPEPDAPSAPITQNEEEDRPQPPPAAVDDASDRVGRGKKDLFVEPSPLPSAGPRAEGPVLEYDGSDLPDYESSAPSSPRAPANPCNSPSPSGDTELPSSDPPLDDRAGADMRFILDNHIWPQFTRDLELRARKRSREEDESWSRTAEAESEASPPKRRRKA